MDDGYLQSIFHFAAKSLSLGDRLYGFRACRAYPRLIDFGLNLVYIWTKQLN